MHLFFSRSVFASKTGKPSSAAIQAHALLQIFSLLRFCLLLTLLFLTVWLLGTGLTILFASALIAVGLYRLGALLRRVVPFSQPVSVMCVSVFIILLTAFAVWTNGPDIASQAFKLKAALEAQTAGLKDQWSNSFLGQAVFAHLPIDNNGHWLTQIGGLSFGMATGLLSSAVGIMATLAVIFMAAFYFALSPDVYMRGLLRLIPPHRRPTARMLLLTAGETLWAWTAGQACDMVVVGLLSGVGLYLLGVPLAITLGIVAGLCNFIPYIGAIIGAVPALLISLSVSASETVLVLILYGVIQFLEGNLIAPMIQKRAVSMPPSIAILAQTLFGTILGVPGLILASPLAAACLAMLDKALPPIDPGCLRPPSPHDPKAPDEEASPEN